MKYFALLPFAILLVGCHQRNEFDVTPSQIQAHAQKGPLRQKLDLNHLPPGAVKQEKIFHKGDKLPDGSVATHDQKLLTVELKKRGAAGGEESDRAVLIGP